MELKGRSAIVTGSSSLTGIGAETAQALAAKGCYVVINYMTNEAGAHATAKACEAYDVDTLIVQGDVSRDEDCRRMAQQAVDAVPTALVHRAPHSLTVASWVANMRHTLIVYDTRKGRRGTGEERERQGSTKRQNPSRVFNDTRVRGG